MSDGYFPCASYHFVYDIIIIWLMEATELYSCYKLNVLVLLLCVTVCAAVPCLPLHGMLPPLPALINPLSMIAAYLVIICLVNISLLPSAVVVGGGGRRR
jgi:hypothetical protein